MNKKGMNLITLTITLVLIMFFMAVVVQIVTKMGAQMSIEKTSANMDLLNIQEQANIAYASIYFDNLRQGVRRELTPEEIRLHMLKKGTGDIDLSMYNIVVKDGDVFVSIKQK